jgi:hypothetical protein
VRRRIDEEEPVNGVERLAELTGRAGRIELRIDWSRAQEELGIPLPPDFRELAERFPAGTFQGYLHLIAHPASLADLRDRRLGDLRRERDHETDEADIEYQDFMEHLYASEGVELPSGPEPERLFPYPLWPEPGGVFPWAESSGIGTYFWLTSGSEPGFWPVVWCHGEELEWEQFDGTCTEFLIALVTGQIDVRRLGAPIFPPPPRFDQWQEGQSIPVAGSAPP